MIFSREEWGVSPVVGTILLIALTVALAAVVMALVGNLGPRGTPPVARLRIVEAGQSGVVLEHEGGDDLVAGETLVRVEVDGGVTEGRLSDMSSVGGTFGIGERATITGVNYSKGDEVRVTVIDQASKMKVFEDSTSVTAVIIKKSPITISGSGSDLTDHQVKIPVDYDSDMQLDFDDLRFRDGDEVTELPYWVEGYNLGENAVVWVKVPSIPASGDKTIYMYYGDPSAESAGDGDATFEFFDDFSDSAESNTNWTRYYETGGSFTVSGGVLEFSSSGKEAYSLCPDVSLDDYIVEAETKHPSSPGPAMGLVVRGSAGGNLYHQEIDQSGLRLYRFQSWAYAALGSKSISVSGGTWYHVLFRVNGTSLYAHSFAHDASVSASDSTFSSGRPGLEVYSQTAYFDNFCVRKYADPEPSVSIGDEALA